MRRRQYSSRVCPEATDEEIDSIVNNKILARLSTSTSNVYRVLEREDYLKTGKLDPNSFIEVLGRFGAIIETDDVWKVMLKYDCSKRALVDYKVFMEAVDPTLFEKDETDLQTMRLRRNPAGFVKGSGLDKMPPGSRDYKLNQQREHFNFSSEGADIDEMYTSQTKNAYVEPHPRPLKIDVSMDTVSHVTFGDPRSPTQAIDKTPRVSMAEQYSKDRVNNAEIKKKHTTASFSFGYAKPEERFSRKNDGEIDNGEGKAAEEARKRIQGQMERISVYYGSDSNKTETSYESDFSPKKEILPEKRKTHVKTVVPPLFLGKALMLGNDPLDYSTSNRDFKDYKAYTARSYAENYKARIKRRTYGRESSVPFASANARLDVLPPSRTEFKMISGNPQIDMIRKKQFAPGSPMKEKLVRDAAEIKVDNLLTHYRIGHTKIVPVMSTAHENCLIDPPATDFRFEPYKANTH